MAIYNAKRLTMVGPNGDTYIIDPLKGNESVYIDLTVTIQSNQWSVTEPYTYVYTDSHITANSAVCVYFKDGVRDGLVGDLKWTKAAGSVTFVTTEPVVGDIPLVIRVIDSVTNATYPVDASMIETDAIIGETNVQGALEDLSEQIGTLNNNLATKVDKPVNVPAGKFFQTDQNGQAVWNSVDASMIETDAIIGETNVQGALEDLSEQIGTLNNNKIDKPTSVAEGKFLQTDSNGDAVWGNAASPTDIANAVTDWLDDNIPAGQTVAVDQSLTISGAAADAKKTGDELSDLKSALPTRTISFKVNNGSEHSSSNDKILFDIGAGDPFVLQLNSNASAIVYAFYSDAPTTGVNILSGTEKTYYGYAAKDIVAFGCYVYNTTGSESKTKLTLFANPILADTIFKASDVNVSNIDEWESGSISSGQPSESTSRIRSKEWIYISKGGKISVDTKSLPAGTVSTPISIIEWSAPKYGSGNIKNDSGWTSGPYTVLDDSYVRVIMRRNDSGMTDDQRNQLWSALRVQMCKNLLTKTRNDLDEVIEEAHTILLGWESGGLANGVATTDNARIRSKDWMYLRAGSIIKVLPNNLPSGTTGYMMAVTEWDDPVFGSSHVKRDSGWTSGPYTVLNDSFVRVVMRRNDSSMTDDQRNQLWSCLRVYFVENALTDIQKTLENTYAQIIGTPYYSKFAKFAGYMYGDGINAGHVAPTDFENFIFFTDPHTMYGDYTYNFDDRTHGCRSFDKYIDELQFAYESSPTDFVLCGGDWNDGGLPETELFKLSRAMEKCKKHLSPFYNCVGNHDTNYQGKKDAESDPYTTILTEESLKDLWYREYEHCYYTFNGRKTKFYVFDTRIETSAINDSDYMMNQLKWFANTLKTDNFAHIALAMHIYYSTGTAIHDLADNVMKVACTYNARGSITIDGTEYNYASSTGKVEFVIVGHSHADFNTRYVFSNTSIAVIGTINAGNGTGSPSSYEGAEHCIFDMVNVDYDNRVINLVRVGTLGADRTVQLDAIAT